MSFLILAGLLLVPITGVVAALDDQGRGEGVIPEFPVGVLSLLLAAGASIVVGSNIIRKKKK